MPENKPTIRELYRRQQEDAGLESLRDSLDASAPYAAFAKGVALGSVMPTALAVNHWASSAASTVADARARKDMAALLAESGIPKENLGGATSAAMNYLRNVDNTPPDIKHVLHPHTTVWRPTESVRASSPALASAEATSHRKEDVENILRSSLKKMDGATKEEVDWMVANSVEGVRRKAPPMSAGLSPQEAKAIRHQAALAFERSGGAYDSTAGILARSLGRRLRAGLPAAAMLGLPAGLAGVARTLSQRRKAEELRGMAKASSDDRPTRDRALQAAPGVAAVPGFVMGASSQDLFDPKTLVGKTKLLGAGGSTRSRLASGVVGAGALATAASLPASLVSTKRAILDTPSDNVTAPVLIKKQASDEMWSELQKISEEKNASLRKALSFFAPSMRKAIPPAIPSQASRNIASSRVSQITKSYRPGKALKPIDPIAKPARPIPPVVSQSSRSAGDLSRGFKTYGELMQEGVPSNRAAHLARNAGTGGKIWRG